MKIAAMIVRYLLGLIMFVFGLNKFLHFIPIPPMPGPDGAFMGALAASGYMMPFIAIVEIVGGLALLSGFYVTLGLLILLPVTVNIFLFHLVLNNMGLPMGGFVFLANLFLLYVNRESLAGVFRAK
jgi:putative oxidoreductase